ncbi:hypothetical protein ACFRJ7_19880 [Streptomyces sp. NPDC056747]|uniref:hypothetical protein n=1 Tax=Streptomyces sp. NPDC056747 TaxID=3345935 RepID=UPI0036C05AB2
MPLDTAPAGGGGDDGPRVLAALTSRERRALFAHDLLLVLRAATPMQRPVQNRP